jgi:hypothetical protein
MRKSGFRHLLTLLALASAGLACELPDNATSQAGPAATQTMQALATEVELTMHPDTAVLGESASESESENEAPEAAVTASPTVTLTPTLGAPMVSVSVDTNCRFGPGNVYEYEGALLVGEQARVTGKLADESYWYIENPDPPPPHCWIWGMYAQISGDTSGLPILTPPPTPTETPIPVDFSLSIDTAGSCMTWGVFLWVENTGSVAFKSSRVSLTDSDLGETTTTDANWFPDIKACILASPPDSLPPGAGSYLSAFGFSANPTGDNVSVTVRLCTEDGLGGDCVQKSVSGTVPSP